MSQAHFPRFQPAFKESLSKTPLRVQNQSRGGLQCSHSPPWTAKALRSIPRASSPLTKLCFQSGSLKSGSFLGAQLPYSFLQRQSRISVKKKVKIKAETVEGNYAGFADVLVKNHFFQDKEVVSFPVPFLDPNSAETEEIVLDALESFHEDTEPWFFSEYRDPPSHKTEIEIQDLLKTEEENEIELPDLLKTEEENEDGEKNKDGERNEDGEKNLNGEKNEDGEKNENGEKGNPPKKNKYLMELFRKFRDPDRKEFLMAQAVLSVEAQVAAAIADEAERKPRTAPSDPLRFRTFGTNEDAVHYPKFFEGDWDVDTVTVCVDVPGGLDKQSEMVLRDIRPLIDEHIKEMLRFINHKGNVIYDAQHNNMSIEPDTISHGCFWDPDNPRQLLIENVSPNEENGDQKRTEVLFCSLLSFDSPEPGVFDCSRFYREARYHRERYKWDPSEESPNEVKGIITTSFFDIFTENNFLVKSVLDKALLMHILSRTQRPNFVSKYVVRMRRRTEANTK